MPQKQPPANTATAVADELDGVSSNAGAGITTASSAACAQPSSATSAANVAARNEIETCSLIPVLLSAERKRVRRDAWIQELDLERAIAYGTLLTDQLIQSLHVHDTRAVRSNVGAMIVARRCAVHTHAKAHRLAVGAGAQNEVQVPGLEVEHDLAGRGVRHGLLLANRPAAA